MNSAVKDVCWAGGPNGTRKELLTLGQDAEVYLWDLGSRKCIARWKDDGAFGPNCLEGGSRGDYYAIGYVY
jgi:U3 small nucleolar RNA-associated protein 18